MSSRLTLAQKLKSTIVVATCSFATFIGFGIYQNNEKFYNSFLMPAIQRCSPELSHRFAVLGLKFHLFPKQKGIDPDNLKTVLLGHAIDNPVGIAAGFDKHAEAVNGLKNIGFGFVEIGSVTPEPQPGNEKPRVFRLIEDKAIINRYGFNSEGHEVVFDRLSKLKKEKNLFLGVNLGKNKQTENAYEDYVKGVEKFGALADYIVINVSSPNTPGLRNLQHKDDLIKLLTKVIQARNSLGINTGTEKNQTFGPPILLKLAPDLTESEIQDIASVVLRKECRVDGLIISNTTVARDSQLKSVNKIETGGLSGAPLRNLSTILIAKMYKLTKGQIPIIGVGGIFNGQDAYEKILAGSSAVQLYTSLIYHGPPIVQKVKQELSDLLKANGFDNIQKACGTKANDYAKQK